MPGASCVEYCVDLAAPRAGVDPADVRRVDPPMPPLETITDMPFVPAHPLPEPELVTIVGPRPLPVTIDAIVPMLEIPPPQRLAVDDFAGVPPMFPRLPGAPETT